MTQLALAGHEQPVAYGDLDFWPTPPWLAARVVEWANVPLEASVIEPSAGDGALLRALPVDCRTVAVEVNPARREALECEAGQVVIGDWPTVAATWSMHDRPAFDLAISNPPFSLIAEHVWPMCCVARRAVVLLPLTALEGQERHRELWSRVVLTRLAILVSRPRFGGHTSPATAYCVVEIRRRAPGESTEPCAVEWWS